MPENKSRTENLKDKEEKKVVSKNTNTIKKDSSKNNTSKKTTSTSKSTVSTTAKANSTVAKTTEKVSNKKVKGTSSTNKNTSNRKAEIESNTKKIVTEKTKAPSNNVKNTNKSANKANNKTNSKSVTESKTTKNITQKTKDTKTKSNVKSNAKKDIKTKEDVKDVKKEVKSEEIKPKESAIISKIKSFLKKIVEIQEEAKKEKLEQKEKEAEKLAKKENKEIEKEKQHTYNIEYYDLPYRYNETVVKILAQTPKRLFVYWDVADSDRERYIKAFGENFFNDTYPVLLIHNDDKNYTFEVPINDFANSWYLDINDPKSKYTIQLGRKFREQAKLVTINREQVRNENIIIQNDYLPITTSNTLEVPNDHILFENLKPYVVYRNVKNYEEKVVDISNLEFAKKMGKVYNIYEVYKEIYKNEMEDESLLDLLNPSSMSSSSFK